MEDLVVVDRLLGLGHLPAQVLQDAFHPASGIDRLAMLATAVYMLHFALPLGTGFVLWVWRRSQFYDFVAALILLSLAAFVTYLLLPAAPPWYAASHGALNGPDGRPVIAYLKPGAFESVAEALGFDGNYIYTYAFYGVAPNAVAAWPSLHIAYPFLTFLVTVPLVFTAMMIPLGINGLGVREWAFVQLLGRAGFPPAAALALLLASYGVAVVQGLLGGAVHVFRDIGERGSAAEGGESPARREESG